MLAVENMIKCRKNAVFWHLCPGQQRGQLTYYGLYAPAQHRGQESAGIAYNGRTIGKRYGP